MGWWARSWRLHDGYPLEASHAWQGRNEHEIKAETNQWPSAIVAPLLNIRGTNDPAHGTVEVTAVELAVINSTLSRPLGLANLLGFAGGRAVVLCGGGCRGVGGSAVGVAVDAGGGGGGLAGSGRGRRGGRCVVVSAGRSIGVAHEGGDGGTREDVVAGTEEVAGDAWVAGTVGTWVRDELVLGGPASAAAADAKLCTAWVKLSTGVVGRGLRSDVESDDLVTDEIVAGSDVGGERNRMSSTVHEVLLEPFTAVGLAANLVDLEPAGVPGIKLAAGLVTAVCEVGDHGASVVRPVAAAITTFPVKANGVAWVDIHNAGSILGANTAVVGWVVHTVDGLKVEHLADGARIAVTVPGAVWGRSPVAGLIANIDGSKISVRRNIGREEDGDECKSGRAHCSRWIVGKG